MHYFVTKLSEWASAQITNRNPYIIDGLPNKTSFPQTRDSVHASAQIMGVEGKAEWAAAAVITRKLW